MFLGSKNKSVRKISIIFLILVFAIWSYTLFHYGPEIIIEFVGINNAYIVLGVAALLGGTSILFPFPYYLFTISFGAAGLNPLLLGLAAGIGTLLGDATTYYIAHHGKHLISKKYTKHLRRALVWSMDQHPSLFPFIAFIYSAITPLPDDVLMIPAGLTGYPFKKLALGVFPGKIVFNTILALTGVYGLELFM
jgi:membrane protein YqaA with SNARE-associated domain